MPYIRMEVTIRILGARFADFRLLYVTAMALHLSSVTSPALLTPLRLSEVALPTVALFAVFATPL